MEAKTVCGGYDNTPIKTSCLTLTSPGTWEKTSTLLNARLRHSSWASPSGLILLGGTDSQTTTEKIQENGTSTQSFGLKYPTALACAINLGSSVLITGGYHNGAVTRVTQYNEGGFLKDYPALKVARYYHGCSYYDNAEGTKVGN